jgi:3-oxoacyl-(acyl-carrier-protein) synthase
VTAVITGIGIIASNGDNIEDVKNNMRKNISFIKKINYFDTSHFKYI